MKLLVVNGPNLNMLGFRDKNVYGSTDYAALCKMLTKKGAELGFEVECYQSNHEGAIIDRLQEALSDGTVGLVINPGAYTHYSYAIHDALEILHFPKVEIHISDVDNREDFRKISVTAPACDVKLAGEGVQGYVHAMEIVKERLK